MRNVVIYDNAKFVLFLKIPGQSILHWLYLDNIGHRGGGWMLAQKKTKDCSTI